MILQHRSLQLYCIEILQCNVAETLYGPKFAIQTRLATFQKYCEKVTFYICICIYLAATSHNIYAIFGDETLPRYFWNLAVLHGKLRTHEEEGKTAKTSCVRSKVAEGREYPSSEEDNGNTNAVLIGNGAGRQQVRVLAATNKLTSKFVEPLYPRLGEGHLVALRRARANVGLLAVSSRRPGGLAARDRRRAITCETRAIRSHYRTTVAPLLRCRPPVRVLASKTIRTALDRTLRTSSHDHRHPTRRIGYFNLKRRLFDPRARRRFAAEATNGRANPRECALGARVPVCSSLTG